MGIKNNKGFAVSTLLYGLSVMGLLITVLLMSIMSSNRVNTASFVNQIEDDLNRYSLTETTIRPQSSSSGAQEFIVPYDQEGWYKIELWGAAGGNKGSNQGGKGAYTSGLIYLEENTHLYFYIGTKGSESAAGKNNAGGSNGTTAGGGGATDVRLESGDYNDQRSLQTRIMVAAGGGGATTTSAGGQGGDLQGYKGNKTSGSALQTCTSFGVSVGSGGGFCNGAASEGGSSYISGYAGGSSWALNTATNTFTKENDSVSIKYAYTVYNPDTGDPTGEYHRPTRGFSFLNGYMVPGVNNEDGKANIERVNVSTTDLEKKIDTNTQLNNIKKIVDCIDNTTTTWSEIEAISKTNEIGGVNVVKTNSTISFSPAATNPNNVKDGNLATLATVSSPAATNCMTVTFNTNVNLDEIAVWHKVGEIGKHSLKACQTTDDSKCVSLSDFDATDNDKIIETTNGLHYTAYRNNTSQLPIDGTYYIVPVKDPASVLTTGNSTLGNDMTIKGAGIDGNKYQKWQLTNTGGNTYVIIEAQNYNSMQASATGSVGETLKASPRVAGSDKEKWVITPTKNGQYTISSPLGTKIIYNAPQIKIAAASTTGQDTKFYLINADY